MNGNESLRPEVVRILGRDYTIDFTDDINSLGLCDPEVCEIAIREGMHPVEEADTVLHEILHGLMFTMHVGLSFNKEEEVVSRLSTGLMQVMQDNPELLTYFANAGTPRKRQ